MEISANFAFLKQEFPHAAESASYAERHVYSDPRASCFHARHALERLVKRVYKVDKTLSPPRVTNLDGYLHEPAFRELVPDVVWQKAEYIRQAGNVAVHGNKTPAPEKALDVVRELSHVLYWAGRTYLRKGAEKLQGKTFDESVVPKVKPEAAPATVEELDAIKAQRDAAEEARKEIESELAELRERLAAIKAENENVPETHDWNEDKTRELVIDLDLQRSGWPLDQPQDREYEVTGMPNKNGFGYADYVLWGDDGKPLAAVEAKKNLGPLAEALARWVRPGAPVVFVVMGPLCLWELAASMRRLDAGQAFRRLSKKGATAQVGDERIRIAYRWPAELARAFEPCFRVERLSALGWALPPSLWSSALEKRPGLLAAMARVERWLQRFRPLAYLSDHYVLELRRIS